LDAHLSNADVADVYIEDIQKKKARCLPAKFDGKYPVEVKEFEIKSQTDEGFRVRNFTPHLRNTVQSHGA
jgi:hypothetical protein